PCALDHGGSADAAGPRQEDREPGDDTRLQQRPEHLRRHARAPHLEPARVGEDETPRRDGTGALRGDRRALVAIYQPLSGDLGPECLPPHRPALRGLRRCGCLSKNWGGSEKEQDMIRSFLVVLAIALCSGAMSAQTAKPAAKSPGAGPVLVVETVKGTIEIETYPNEAPKTVDHILALVKRNFYNGQRILRIVPNQLVQFGDPQTRDMTKQAWWGRGFDAGSGHSIGLAEFSKKRLPELRLQHHGVDDRLRREVVVRVEIRLLHERLGRLRRFRKLLQLARRVQVVVAVLAAVMRPPLRGVSSVQAHVVEARDVWQIVLPD